MGPEARSCRTPKVGPTAPRLLDEQIAVGPRPLAPLKGCGAVTALSHLGGMDEPEAMFAPHGANQESASPRLQRVLDGVAALTAPADQRGTG